MSTPAIYRAIGAVQAALSKQGIAKDRRNQQQGYAFRGIDDVYSALAPLLASNGLVIVPLVISREVTERKTVKGAALFYVTVDVEYTLCATEDGSTATARIIGEAMDSGDKATNKAMSAAYKYLCLQLFCIPTEGDNDADATTHEVAAVARPQYPEEQFQAHIGQWAEMVSAGKKTPEQIIAMIGSKYTLSDDQIARIKSISEVLQ